MWTHVHLRNALLISTVHRTVYDDLHFIHRECIITLYFFVLPFILYVFRISISFARRQSVFSQSVFAICLCYIHNVQYTQNFYLEFYLSTFHFVQTITNIKHLSFGMLPHFRLFRQWCFLQHCVSVFLLRMPLTFGTHLTEQKRCSTTNKMKKSASWLQLYENSKRFSLRNFFNYYSLLVVNTVVTWAFFSTLKWLRQYLNKENSSLFLTFFSFIICFY